MSKGLEAFRKEVAQADADEKEALRTGRRDALVHQGIFSFTPEEREKIADRARQSGQDPKAAMEELTRREEEINNRQQIERNEQRKAA